MIIRLSLVLVFLVFASLLHSQGNWCGTGEKLKEAKQNGEYEKFLQLVRNHTYNSIISPRSEIFFPVVVHVVTRAQVPMISYAQVIQQIDVLNDDFAKKGDNISKLAGEFESIAADTEIRFCLASIDPFGNPTNGITYTTTDKQDIALQPGPGGRISVHYDQLKGKTGWDTSRYINIWVAEYGTGILGSASLPGTAPYPEEIGIVMDLEHFGAIGTASMTGFFNRGHTLTHEMGHYFGLLHIWGDEDDSCTDSDEVDDTPNAEGPYLDCPSGIQMTCGESNMYQNFMDLTDDRCLTAFTEGQALRMQSVIDMFYPGLGTALSCQPATQPFEEWWDDLVWAYDAGSRQVVVYSPSGNTGNWNIDLFAADGRWLQNDSFSDNRSHLIDLDKVSAGIYFIRVEDGSEFRVRKIVVY